MACSALAADRRGRRPGSGLAGGACGAGRKGAARRAPVRLGARRGMAPRAAGWRARDRLSDRRHCHAWPLDPTGLDRRRWALAPPRPPVCINRSLGRQPGGFPDAQRASLSPGRPAFRTERGFGPLTTDRLITPFHASRAQSGPRKVSPMNFSGGSRSIQRLLTVRPLLTCWSRGRT